MCRLAVAGPVPRWCEGRNVWLSTPSVEPDVLWFCCVNQLASVYWPPKMFVTTVSIMVLVGPGPPTPANKCWDLDCAGILLQPGCQRERVSDCVVAFVSSRGQTAQRLGDFHDASQSGNPTRHVLARKQTSAGRVSVTASGSPVRSTVIITSSFSDSATRLPRNKMHMKCVDARRNAREGGAEKNLGVRVGGKGGGGD